MSAKTKSQKGLSLRNEQIVAGAEQLTRLAMNIPPSLFGMKVGEILDALAPHVRRLEKERTKLLEEYAVRNEDGSWSLNALGRVNLTNQREFDEKEISILEGVAEITVPLLSLEDIRGLEKDHARDRVGVNMQHILPFVAK